MQPWGYATMVFKGHCSACFSTTQASEWLHTPNLGAGAGIDRKEPGSFDQATFAVHGELDNRFKIFKRNDTVCQSWKMYNN